MIAVPAKWQPIAGMGAAVAVLLLMYQALKPKGQRLFNRQRAAGVHPKLQEFLTWWEEHGPFPISVVAEGGVRTDEAKQRDFFNRGVSKAATLKETPHGRAAALDLAPYDTQKKAPVFTGVDAEFAAIGSAAKAHGLVWGGDWTGLKDLPHVELPNWRSLPFPPRY